MGLASFQKFNLTVNPNADEVCFGACLHMDVGNWPEGASERLSISQELACLEYDRRILKLPVPAQA